MMQRQMMIFGSLLIGLLAACAPDGTPESEPVAQTAPTSPPPTAAATEPSPTATDEPEPLAAAVPTETAVPPTNTPVPPTGTPADTPTPEATIERLPLWPEGTTANLTVTDDVVGIEGIVEVIGPDQIVIRDFVSLVPEAPGVDIRLGVDDDFSDAVAVSLKDITGKEYEGRSLTLTLPDAAFDGRSFNSIGVFCFDTGDLFDYALFETP